MSFRKAFVAFSALGLLQLTGSAALAQVGPLTITTQGSPGSTLDQYGHALQALLMPAGIEVTVVNAPGAGGATAALQVKPEPADGHHLLLSAGATLTYIPNYTTVAYATDDFEPLVAVGHYQAVMITAAGNPDSDIRAMIARVKTEGRPLRWAYTAPTNCLPMKAVAAAQGITVECVLSNGPALLDLVVTGQVDVGIGTGTHASLLAAGTIKVIGRLSSTASGDTPTLADLGAGNAELDDWMLLSVPRGVDPAVKAALLQALLKAASDPSIAPLLTDKLLMGTGVQSGADLTAALDRQRAALDVLAGFTV